VAEQKNASGCFGFWSEPGFQHVAKSALAVQLDSTAQLSDTRRDQRNAGVNSGFAV
jgi:hypothetical protein